MAQYNNLSVHGLAGLVFLFPPAGGAQNQCCALWVKKKKAENESSWRGGETGGGGREGEGAGLDYGLQNSPCECAPLIISPFLRVNIDFLLLRPKKRGGRGREKSSGNHGNVMHRSTSLTPPTAPMHGGALRTAGRQVCGGGRRGVKRGRGAFGYKIEGEKKTDDGLSCPRAGGRRG